MFCRAKGKLPLRSVRPATLATAKKVPELSSKSSAFQRFLPSLDPSRSAALNKNNVCGLVAKYSIYKNMYVILLYKFHVFVCTYVYIIYVQRKKYKVLQFNSSFSIAESGNSHPKCRRHCWITGSTKALPQWTRQAVQRWHGKDAVGQIDVEISCWPGWSKIMMVGFLGVLLLWNLWTNLFHHRFIRSFLYQTLIEHILTVRTMAQFSVGVCCTVQHTPTQYRRPRLQSSSMIGI